MATSFTRTRTQIATKVMNKVTQLGAGTVSTADADLIYEAIDLRLKEMHKLGIFWRKVNREPLSFTVTASTSSASASADILFPVAITITDSSEDVALDIIGVREYTQIVNKAETGLPVAAYWKGSAEFIFWPVPTTTTTAKLTYESIAEDSSAGAAIDIDVSMLKSFIDIICYDVGDDFGVNENKMRRWASAAEMAERNIRKLGSQHVDLTRVAVDDFESSSVESDYNRYR